MTIREQEDAIRYLDYEMAFVWNDEGRLILEKEGGEYKIIFTDEEALLISKCILTHNHPHAMKFLDTDPRSFGHSFSQEDIQFACYAELAEVRAVTRKLRFSMKPPPVGWNQNYWNTVISPRFEHHFESVWNELFQAFSSGKITSAEADVRVLHETWMRLAHELGLVYTQETT